MLSEWIVAAAEICLASGTVYLATQARSEAREVGKEAEQVAEQVKLQREQMEASLRPIVLPVSPQGWSDGSAPYHSTWVLRLPVKNGGPGAAINLRAVIEWTGDGVSHVESVATSLAPGDAEDLRLAWADDEPRFDWSSAQGVLSYDDIASARWRTEFTITIEGGHRQINTGSIGQEMRGDRLSEPM
jgi:hypothetical protein